MVQDSMCRSFMSSDPYKSMWKNTGCLLHISSVRCVSRKEVEGKLWPEEEKE